MTNHWRDIRHADLMLINGANPAEAHPVGFRWMMKAKLERGAKMIHADPRFTRTSAVADVHLRIRTGSDVAYFGGLINYVLQNKLYHEDYVRRYTNAALVVKKGYEFKDGLFNGYDPETRTYDPTAWAYEAAGPPKRTERETRKAPLAHGPGPSTSTTPARSSTSCASTTPGTRRRWSSASPASPATSSSRWRSWSARPAGPTR
jgi:anaerobic selenocysteine-containing dehydrogenase